MGLEQANHRLVDGLRLLPQVVHLEARRASPPSRAFRRRPAPSADPPCAPRRPCARSAAPASCRCPGGRADDPRLTIDIGKIDVVVEAAPAQRVGELARAVRGEHDARDRRRFDRAELGNGDLEVGQELEQEGLEFLVGAVDLVDQQDRRLLAPDRGQQRPLKQIFSEKMCSSIASAFSPRLRAP